jgi:hypothetical protein
LLAGVGEDIRLFPFLTNSKDGFGCMFIGGRAPEFPPKKTPPKINSRVVLTPASAAQRDLSGFNLSPATHQKNKRFLPKSAPPLPFNIHVPHREMYYYFVHLLRFHFLS